MGVVYKITCKVTKLQYVGTCSQDSVGKAVSLILKRYRSWKNGKGGPSSVYTIIENGNYGVELLESCPNNDDLPQKSREWIEKLGDCLNKVVPTRTKREYSQESVQCNCGSTVRKNHLSEHVKTQKHKNGLSGTPVKTGEKNNEECECECGGVFKKRSVSVHNKSQRHQEYLERTGQNKVPVHNQLSTLEWVKGADGKWVSKVV
jgi:hypothetical protein